MLTGVRICQLYAFMLVFELLMTALGVPIAVLVWAVNSGYALVQGNAASSFVLQDIHLRSPVELLFLANVWLVFLVYADFRRNYWVLILCVLALGHNIEAAYTSLFSAPDIFPSTASGVDSSFHNSFFRYAFMTGLVLSHVYFLMVAVRGQRSTHSLSPEQAEILSEFRPRARKTSASLLQMINVPGTIRYSRHRLWTGFLQVMAGVANFLNYWILFMALIAVSLAPGVYSIYREPVRVVIGELSSKGITSARLGASAYIIVTFGLLIAILIIFPLFTFWLGRTALRLSRGTMRRSLHEIQGEDPRPPILFLRSFLDDQVALDRGPFLLEQWLLDSGSRSMTLDYLLLSEGTDYGPTVALGNPQDPAPPYGVARGYFEHSTWKTAVGALCQRASAIIMVLDTTEGLEWEIGHIVANQYVAKTLFLLAPSDVGTERGEMLTRRAVAACGGDIGAFVESGTDRQVVGFWLGGEDRIEPLTSSRLTAYTYLMAIRLFFRTRIDEIAVPDSETRAFQPGRPAVS